MDHYIAQKNVKALYFPWNGESVLALDCYQPSTKNYLETMIPLVDQIDYQGKWSDADIAWSQREAVRKLRHSNCRVVRCNGKQMQDTAGGQFAFISNAVLCHLNQMGCERGTRHREKYAPGPAGSSAPMPGQTLGPALALVDLDHPMTIAQLTLRFSADSLPRLATTS